MKQPSSKKILAVASAGAHIDYLVAVIDAFDGATIELATFNTPWTSDLSSIPLSRVHRVFCWETISRFSVLVTMLVACFQALYILCLVRPNVIFSTGAELALPFFFIGRLIPGVRLVHLETASRPNQACLSGRILMRIADTCFVQWPEQAQRYNRWSIFKGRVF